MGQDRWETSKLGYLSHLTQGQRHWGGLLVVDMDGDPVDFAFTDVVEISRLASPLFRNRLNGYLVGKVMVSPLLEAIEAAPDILCFNEPGLLSRKLNLDIPLAVYGPSGALAGNQWIRTEMPPDEQKGHIWFSEKGEERRVESVLEAAARQFAPVSIAEPFDRLLLALKERTEAD